MSILTAALPMTQGMPDAFDTSSPTLTRQWLQESWLVPTRWVLALLCLMVIHFIPEAGWVLPIMLTLALALANAGIGYCLSHNVDAKRVSCARLIATVAEWIATLTIIALCARDPQSMAPALLLPVLVLTTVRFGVLGLLGSAVAAALIMTALVSAQVHALHILDWSEGAPLLAGTVLLVVWTALPIAGSAHAANLWRRWELDRWERDDANLRRLQCGLSEREWEILQLLAHDEFTYLAIGDQLHISPETVKTHVQHIGTKFGVSGRKAVSKEAIKLGLIVELGAPDEGRLVLP